MKLYIVRHDRERNQTFSPNAAGSSKTEYRLYEKLGPARGGVTTAMKGDASAWMHTVGAAIYELDTDDLTLIEERGRLFSEHVEGQEPLF